MSRSRSVHTYVEVDLDEFDDDDIEAEYELRGLGGGGDFKDRIQELFYAFHFGKTDKAMEIARALAQDATGRVLG
jgi:hypothetical protein